jgi:endonuclease/exonuclease/phosphatase (EEP) superfamily protein YafD
LIVNSMASQTTPATPPKKLGVIDRALLLASLVLCLAVAAVYAVRADAFAAVTVCPPWVWGAPGLAAILIVRLRRRGGWLVRLTLLAWAAYWLATVDTPSALVRSVSRRMLGRSSVDDPTETAVRVVSLNCGSFGHRSARDVIGVSPQIVLLQESPGKDETEALTRQLFGARGGYIWSSDASIIADGAVTPAPFNDVWDGHAVCARVRLATGRLVEVVSLRLEPAIVRLDFWSADCWRSQTQNRRLRRRQLSQIVDRLANLPRSTPLILGGDFNAPAGDAIFDLLTPRLRDAYREAGVGWGNTIINEAPFARIDQIWIDDHWQGREVRAQRTLASDHRMVIADLTLKSDVPRDENAVGPVD